jgi:hypothetical protein
MILAILAIFHVLAAQFLDTEMSAQDKKNTGLIKLTTKEKQALQNWIDANYQKKELLSDTTASHPIKGTQLTLSENLLNSRYLRLSDGTLWNIRPEDIPIAQGWITPVEIAVSQSSAPFFPYKLTNKVSGSAILARKAEKLPQSGSPPPLPTSEAKTF